MKAKILTTLSLLLGILLISGITVAQPISTTAPTVTSCPGNSVSVPITVQNFSNVASISLTLTYNTSSLTYLSYVKNSSLSGFEITNPTMNQIKSAYFGLAPLSLANGSVLYTYAFNYINGSSPLSWDLSDPGFCQYSDVIGNPLPADWFDGSVSPAHLPPSVLNQPVSLTVNEGGNASFFADMADATNYQWEVSFNNGTSWSNVTDGSIYSGATTATLSITAATFAMNNYQYRCQVSENVCNQAINTDHATLTVNQVSSSIGISASNITACPGEAVSVQVNGTNVDNFNSFSLTLGFNPAVVSYVSYGSVNSSLGTGSFTETVSSNKVRLQYTSIAPVSLGNSDLLSFNFNYISGSGSFTWSSVAGENEFSSTNSGVLTSNFSNGSITYNAPAPIVTVSPGNQTITENTTAHFNITAVGATDYQWQVSTNGGFTWSNLSNNSNYVGVNTASLTINNTPISFNTYKYRCVVSESTCNQSANSGSGSVNVNAATTGITVSIGSMSGCPGNQVVFPITATNFNDIYAMNLTVNYDPTSLTYVTHQNDNADLTASGFWQINNNGNQWFLAWFAMTPANLGSLTVTEMVFQVIDPVTVSNSEVNFDTLTPGLCAVSDLIGNAYPATFVSGTFTISGGLPIITTQPMSTGVSNGSSAMFMAEGQGTNTYVWQEKTVTGNWTSLTNNSTYSGVSSTMLMISNVTQSMDGNQYRCIVSGGVCNQSINTSAATLNVYAAGTIITTAGYLNTCPGGNISIPITVSNLADVASISLKMNYDVSSLTYVGYQNLNPALTNGLIEIAATNGQVALGWLNVTPITIANGAVLVEYQFNYIQNFSPLTWDLTTPGNCIYTNTIGATLPSAYFNGLVESAGPLVTSNPSNVSVNNGTNASFAVSATNASAYHWQVNTGLGWANLNNNTMYSGVLTNTLNITAVTIGMDNYQYRCVVTGVCGNTNTTAGLLHVIFVNPIITTVSTATHCPGNITIPITVDNFQNVGSFNLRLTYTSAILSYNAYTAVNSSLTGALNVTSGVGFVNISYTGSSSVTIPNGAVLLNIKLNGSAGNSPLTWDITSVNGCKYQSVGGSNLNATFVNGNITVNSLPGFPGTITGTSSMCEGTVVSSDYTTTGSANALTYEWTLMPTNAGTITGTGTTGTLVWDPTFVGSVTVVVKGVNACGTGSANGKGVTVNPLPNTSLSPFGLWCTNTPPDTLTGGVPTGGTYSGPGITNNIFDPVAAGIGAHTITYTYTNTYGCTKSGSQTLTVNQAPNVALTLTPAGVHPAYVPYVLTGGAPVGGTYSGVNVNPATGVFIPSWIFTPQQGGTGFATITYTYQTVAGCIDSATSQLAVSITSGMQTIEHGSYLAVNPNPSNGVFQVKINGLNEDASLIIMNNLGQAIYQEKINAVSGVFNNEIDLSKQPKGIYFLRLIGSKLLKEEKIVIQ
jgi:hypothetical protein